MKFIILVIFAALVFLVKQCNDKVKYDYIVVLNSTEYVSDIQIAEIEEKKIEYGKNYFVDTQVYAESKKLEKRDIIAMIGSILLAGITGTVLVLCNLTAGGLVVYGVGIIWLIVALCGIMSEKNRRISGNYFLPIRFYGNDKVFGYTSVQNAEYAEDLPPVHIVEVNKDEIESVEYDNKIHCHLVSLKNDVNIGDGKLSKTLEIPDFFSKETLSKMFGK